MESSSPVLSPQSLCLFLKAFLVGIQEENEKPKVWVSLRDIRATVTTVSCGECCPFSLSLWNGAETFIQVTLTCIRNEKTRHWSYPYNYFWKTHWVFSRQGNQLVNSKLLSKRKSAHCYCAKVLLQNVFLHSEYIFRLKIRHLFRKKN